jgi:hypothetical protein
MCLLVTSCLVTDELTPRQVPPEEPNSPPRFEESSIHPASTMVLRPIDGCTIVMEVDTIIDEDLDDKLTARWFINFDPEAEENPVVREVDIAQPTPNASTTRLGGDATTYTFHADQKDLGLYVIYLVVSDGFSNEANRPAAAREGKAAVSYVWFIDSTGATDCVGGSP